MVATVGLVGLRPTPEHVARVTTPPYDVIKSGSPLEALLRAEPASLFHVILGEAPREALERLVRDGYLRPDEEPCFYVYEQRWPDGSRTGVLVAAEVSDYAERRIVRHEKTFDDKVKGRIALARATGYTAGPVFVLTRAPLDALLEEAKGLPPAYAFTTDLRGLDGLHGITSRLFRVPAASELGRRLAAALAPHPFYIADGHHRYHAALLGGQSHFLCYVTSEARIQAYDRVVTGDRPFASIRRQLPLEPVARFETPPKHRFGLYTREGTWQLPAHEVPTDVVGRLDCSILERELYPLLGLEHASLTDAARVDYYPESELERMRAAVDEGRYDLAIALHPVSLEELLAVAHAGLDDPSIVMPEKSTFFAPKILSGLFLYRHRAR